MAEEGKFERLPTNVVPSNYNLRLTPDLAAFTFVGTLEIDVQVQEPTSVIKLNASELSIQSAAFVSGEGTSFEVKETTLNAKEEVATFTFDGPLPCGPGSLNINYTGELNDRMKGFYRSKYRTPTGETRYAATTQMEPTYARLALPCWDEPAVKATFDITLVVPKEKVALSNMPVVTDEPLATDPACKVVTFERTPIMSTYLLAFIVGEYDYIETKDADGVLVRVYTPEGKSEQGKFALEVAAKSLPFYKNYFGISYPLPKLDLIAIADFSAGAMENWGLVTYRENRLLIDPKESSLQNKIGVALVVGHELAHMWFGNLVTMEWWTHLWLNEGFATFVEYLAVDHCFPEYNIWSIFVSSECNRALTLDGLSSSHPIEVPVEHPAQVEEIFDAISYSKGSCVIRMLYNWLGDEMFRKGLGAYLKKHQYKNAITEDLWESLGEASGLPVRQVMSTWTSQMGYPVISVSERQEGDNRILTLTQKKFCADGKKPETDALWMVPIKLIVCGKENTVTYLLEGQTGEVTIPNVAADDPIKVNPCSVGFYRVKYEGDMLGRLTQCLPSLAPLDRLDLLDDSFALAYAGMQSLVEPLRLAKSYTDETDYNVWGMVLSKLASVRVWVMGTDFYGEFKKYCIELLEKVVAHVGWEKDESEVPSKSLLRALVLGRIGRLGHAPTVAEAQKRLDDHLAGTKELPADLRSAVYGTLLKNGPHEYFNTIKEIYETSTLQEERMRVMTCLGAVEDEGRLTELLKFALTVRSGDLPMVIGGMTHSLAGRRMAWEWYKDNNKLLIQRYEGGFLLRRIFGYATESFDDEAMCSEIEAFMKANPAPATERTLRQSLDSIRVFAATKARECTPVRDFLLAQ